MNCFVDTSAFLALLDRDDKFHLPAAARWSQLISDEWELTVSSYGLLETFALCQRRLGMKAVRQFQNDVVPVLTVVWVDQRLHDAGATALLASGKRKLSLVDCVSFEVMRSNHIACAFAYDRHFNDQGFELLS